MVSKYSSKAISSRSELTKTISNFPLSFSEVTLVYHSANFGVNPRHGGHQWALKYSPSTFPGPSRLVTGTVSPFCPFKFATPLNRPLAIIVNYNDNGEKSCRLLLETVADVIIIISNRVSDIK